MDFIYDFILNNQILLFIIALLLIMAIIGYIAEQHGFYKNNDLKDEDLEPVDEKDNKEILDSILDENDALTEYLNTESKEDRSLEHDTKNEETLKEEAEVEVEQSNKQENVDEVKNEDEVNFDEDYEELPKEELSRPKHGRLDDRDITDEVKDDIEEKKKKDEQENLNIDKDFGKLLNDEEELIINDANDDKISDIDDDLWKF